MAAVASEIGKRIDAITRGALTARLKEHGYRKKGRTFHRHGDDATCVVNVQASLSNVGSTGSFTINLGVYFPGIEEPLTGGAPSDPPREVDCTLRRRLGGLMPDTRGDYWWSVSSTSDLDAISREVAEAWRVYGRPWLDANATLAGASQTLARRSGLHGAVASMLLGDRAEAERRLRSFLETCPPAATIARVRAERWAQSVGIVTDA
jgi:hypothetical protein